MKPLLLTITLALTLPLSAQTPLPIIPPTGHVPTPDVSIAYWLYGAPQKTIPIFAVNGGPGLSHLYMVQNDLWQRVSQHRQVIFYDQRGTGLSPLINPSAPQTIDAQVADLDAVRAHLNLSKIDLCGDSYGGLLVIAYATAHPDRVHQLIISDGLASWSSIVHLFPQVFPDKLEANALAAKASTATPDQQEQQGLRDHFDMIFYDRAKLARYMANAKDLGYSPKTGEAVGKATEKLDYTEALKKFNFPTLVITGRYDMNVAPLTAWQMYKAIPGAKFAVFEQSGHLPSYEEPEKYLKVLTDFLIN
jgi:proline iminopeptidase